jgi:hypothetical protein
MLRELATDLWVADGSLRFVGIEVGRRMTVVRLPGRRLVVHSPVPPEPALVAEVVGLGSVDWLVAPNRFHHLSIEPWAREFPESAVLLAPGLKEKRPELRVTAALSDGAPAEWAGEIELLRIDGAPRVNEVVLFHRSTGTLIAADLAFNIGPSSPFVTRLLFRLAGRPGELAPTAAEKLLIRDRPAFRLSLERVLAWPIERVIVSHGDVVEKGGRQALARGYDWLLQVS